MYSEPCARLIMSMMPNTSVSPAASRNSIKPNCTPFRVCSRNRVALTAPPRGWLFQLAVLGPEVLVAGQHGADLLVDDAALIVLCYHAHIVVLDGSAVVRGLPVAARRLEAPRRAHQRPAELGRVLDLALR